MGVFSCDVCGHPAAYFSHSPEGMVAHSYECPGPPPKAPRTGEPPQCPYCGKPDEAWDDNDLKAGKRRRPLGHGPGVDYHCTEAFFGAS